LPLARWLVFAAKFLRAQEAAGGGDRGVKESDESTQAAAESQDTGDPGPGRMDTRGGMMIVFTCPLMVHIVIWDFTLRLRHMLGAEAFEGTPLEDWEPPSLSLYHYLLVVLIALHFVRRFAESLLLHIYSSGAPTAPQPCAPTRTHQLAAACRHQHQHHGDARCALFCGRRDPELLHPEHPA
jgi:hypothetical protein